MFEFIYQNTRLVLPSPRQENTYGIRLGTTIKEAMDGTIWAYARRPNKRIFTLNFAYLSAAKRLEVDRFFKATMGQTIEMRDHNGVFASGRIITVPFTPIDSGRHNSIFTIEFEEV